MTNKKTEEKIDIQKPQATRDAFGEALLQLGEKNPDIIVLTADLLHSTRVKDFAEKFPERFLQVGVAEQNMASISAGVALAGKIPVMTSFGVFSPGRNWDQIRVGICYNNTNVKIVSTHTGLTVGKDGATHQALEDIALMRVLPNMTVLSPIDGNETKKILKEAVSIEGPVYIRLARAKTPVVTSAETKFKIGEIYTLEEGEKTALIGTGPILTEGLEAAREINTKYPRSIKVINVPTIKPLNKKNLLKELEGFERVFTLEEHQIAGGFGSLICEILSQKQAAPKITRLGMQDSFGESGSYQNLKKKYKLAKESIKEFLMEGIK